MDWETQGITVGEIRTKGEVWGRLTSVAGPDKQESASAAILPGWKTRNPEGARQERYVCFLQHRGKGAQAQRGETARGG